VDPIDLLLILLLGAGAVLFLKSKSTTTTAASSSPNTQQYNSVVFTLTPSTVASLKACSANGVTALQQLQSLCTGEGGQLSSDGGSCTISGNLPTGVTPAELLQQLIQEQSSSSSTIPPGAMTINGNVVTINSTANVLLGNVCTD
jgi:hypothetical protein